MGESEHRCYLCGLADGLSLARAISDEGQLNAELDRVIGLVGEARMIQLFDLLGATVESMPDDLLHFDKV